MNSMRFTEPFGRFVGCTPSDNVIKHYYFSRTDDLLIIVEPPDVEQIVRCRPCGRIMSWFALTKLFNHWDNMRGCAIGGLQHAQ